jgi:putative transposase
MTFRLVDAEKAQHPVSLLCSVLGVTRAGYYAWRRRGRSRRALGDAELVSLIGRVFVESLETYGAPRVHAELREGHGVRVGRKRVARLMRQLELEGVSRRGKRQRTTIPDPAAAPAPDLVGRRFTASRPNELWLADITYLPTREGWLFLAVVLDAFSRRIVGWSMRDDLKAELVVDALGMAVTRRRPPAGVVHHSDRGSQYTSLAFGTTLRESGLVASMGRRGDAYDNAACESVISTIKNELIKRRSWTSRDQARLAVFSYIETFYNPRRRHSALGYRSPIDYENTTQEAPANAAAA